MNIVLNETVKMGEVKRMRDSSLPKTLICFSHLRWDFVFQRPQHLLTRLAATFDILFLEEPIFDGNEIPSYKFSERRENIKVVVPHIKAGLSAEQVTLLQRELFDDYMRGKNLSDFAFWYYTPMALEFTRKYLPDLVVFDCMDELSAFKFAPAALKEMEKELLAKADVVFTGGQSLYEAKKNQHANIHAFPSSIEKEHFLKARSLGKKVKSEGLKSAFKLGFYGVVDERFDIELIKGIADARPEWEIVIIGPVVKIDPKLLPKNKNISYLGSKSYQELPALIASWDIALIPFLLNDSTKFISPTKTPEYLAAGLPVISTPIKDVINPYGKNKLVSIGHNADDFVAAAELEYKGVTSKKDWLMKVDLFLNKNSWDITTYNMLNLMKSAVKDKLHASIAQ